MLHPHTELRFVSEDIGYGIFATADIPKGTITWVKDQLDRVFTEDQLRELTKPNLENLLKYSYRNNRGEYVFCWDQTRYVNHSFTPNSMVTAMNFEVAIRDIKAGEEITNDYGTFNIIAAFPCAKEPGHERHMVYPDDLDRYAEAWDKLVQAAFPLINNHAQPLQIYFNQIDWQEVQDILSGKRVLPSLRTRFFRS